MGKNTLGLGDGLGIVSVNMDSAAEFEEDSLLCCRLQKECD